MTEKRKRLSLGDRIREAAVRDINSQESQDARARLARLTMSKTGATPDQDPIKTGATPDQDPIKTGATHDQDPIKIGATPDQDPIKTGATPDQDMSRAGARHELLMSSSRARPEQDLSKTTSKTPVKTAEKTTKFILTSQQFCIYKWFKENGSKGYFNKSIVEKETGSTFITIRRTLEKFQQIGLISLGDFNQAIKRQEYILEEGIGVICLEADLSEQDFRTEGARHEQDMSKVHPGSSYIERKILLKNLKNLSFFLNDSQFWKKYSLTLKKVQGWMEKFDMDANFMLEQLQMAEASPHVNKADDPVEYIHGCFVKDGGITRPKNFESPEEKRARIKAESLAANEALIKKQQENREKEKELAKAEAFFLFLKNEDAVLETISEIEKSHVTPKLKIEIDLYKTNRNITDRLEKRLKIHFESD